MVGKFMKLKIILFIVAFFATTAFGKVQDSKKNQDSKNVLFIYVDDFRPEINGWGHSYIKTPNINRLVDSGISFTNTFCQYANSSPSRKSCLTGLSPESTGHLGHYGNYGKIMNHTTMPGYYHENGYYTLSYGKVYHTSSDDMKSWDLFFDVKYPNTREFAAKKRAVPWESYGLTKNKLIDNPLERPAVECEDLPLENYNDYNICIEAIKGLEKNKDKKFFMAVGFRKPHLPYAAPKRFWDMYDRDSIELTSFRVAPIGGDSIVHQWSELANYSYFTEHYRTKDYRNVQVNLEKAKELQHGYYACVSYIDFLIGKLLDKLDELNLRKNTLIVLLGDHGYHLGEQQIWGKHSCFNLSTNVPLIISNPTAKQKGVKCEKFVESLDLYPTLAQLSGLPEPKNCDGKSFSVLFDNPNADGFDASFNQYQSFQPGKIKDYMGYAIHTKDFTYIEWQDLTDNYKIVNRELYSVKINRTEHVNLVGLKQYEGIIKELSERIRMKFTPYRAKYNKYNELKKDFPKEKKNKSAQKISNKNKIKTAARVKAYNEN